VEGERAAGRGAAHAAPRASSERPLAGSAGLRSPRSHKEACHPPPLPRSNAAVAAVPLIPGPDTGFLLFGTIALASDPHSGALSTFLNSGRSRSAFNGECPMLNLIIHAFDHAHRLGLVGRAMARADGACRARRRTDGALLGPGSSRGAARCLARARDAARSACRHLPQLGC
jgi:hypothetical protein